jgi:hypothetical protein
VAAARLESHATITEITGTIRPVQRARLAAKLMGAIEELPVGLGQKVRAGDLLVKISAGEITARVAQAQAQLNVARRDLERERDLLTKGASTADLVRGLEDRFAMTQAMMREAEVMLTYATIRAPFDGLIARKPANLGDLAAPGLPCSKSRAWAISKSRRRCPTRSPPRSPPARCSRSKFPPPVSRSPARLPSSRPPPTRAPMRCSPRFPSPQAPRCARVSLPACRFPVRR